MRKKSEWQLPFLVAAATAAGFVAALLVGSSAYFALDFTLGLSPSDPPFEWALPTFGCGVACGVLGAVIAGAMTFHSLRSAELETAQRDSAADGAARRS